jgi:hypothetical protein
MDEDQQQEGQQEEEQKEQRIAPAAFTSFNISAPPRRPISSLALFQRQSAEGDEELAAAVKSNQTAITSINSTLAAVTIQISALNKSLVQVAEQIKQSAALENLKMAQERKQEMMLADRNLRRGAENNVERGIQAALFAPVQRIGAKATFTLTRLINFFNVLLGGFLVGRALNLITALVNDDKEALKKIGDTIVGQLAAAGGIFLAINGGLLIALNSLTRLATFLTQVAVSNLLIKPIRLIFNIAKGLVTAIAAGASSIFNNVAPPTNIGPQNNKPNNKNRNRNINRLGTIFAVLSNFGFATSQISQGADPKRELTGASGGVLSFILSQSIGRRMMASPNFGVKALGLGVQVLGPLLGYPLTTTGYDLITQSAGFEAISGDVSKDISTSIDKIKQNNIIVNQQKPAQPAPFGAEGRAALIMFAPSNNINNMYLAFSHIQYNVPMV